MNLIELQNKLKAAIRAKASELFGIELEQLVTEVPPRKVGTPDSAETPAPVIMRTLLACANLCLSSSEINDRIFGCIE